MNNFLNAAIKANREIYAAINGSFKQEWFNEHEVGAGGDVSSGIDLFAESVFVKHLQEFGQIVSEESGIIGEGEDKIIIDPLDGSSNVLSRFPYYGTSVALTDKNGNVKEAVVCNLANGDVFYKKEGSSLKSTEIESLNFKDEVLILNPKVGLFERSYEYSGVVKKLNEKKLKFRAPGAVALSLAYAHRVKFVIYIGRVREYDIKAAVSFCSDLQVKISNNYVIVTREKEFLDLLEKIVLEEIK